MIVLGKSSRFFLLLLILLLTVGCRNTGAETATPETTIITDPAANPETVPVIDTNQPSATSPIIQTTSVLPLPPSIFIDVPAGSAIPPGATVQHTVAEGEWLLQIARCYGANYTAVRNQNPHIYNPNWIMPATVVTVPNVGSDRPVFTGPPCVQRYVVQPGDTWDSIAATFGTTAVILQKANPVAFVAGAQIYVPALAVTAVAPPARTHNLVFNFNGDLAIWQSSDNRVEVIPDASTAIVDITTDASGNRVLVRQTVDGGATIQVALIDRTVRNIAIIENQLQPETTAAVQETMLLSNNGQWGAYIARQEGSYRLTTFQTATPDTLNNLPGIAHGMSENELPQLFAGSNNDQFYWLDRTGIYQYDYALASGETRLHEITSTLENPSGPLLYRAVGWSPNGRFLLMLGGFIEGGAYFVMDKESGTIVELPNSSGYVNRPAAAWLPDDSVIVLNPTGTESATGLTLGTYVLETVDGVFTAREVVAGMPQGAGNGLYGITMPLQQTTAGLVMTLQGTETAVNGIWTGGRETVTRVNGIPAESQIIGWVPDGSGVLIDLPAQANGMGDVAYVSANGGAPFSLARWLDIRISDFHWVR